MKAAGNNWLLVILLFLSLLLTRGLFLYLMPQMAVSVDLRSWVEVAHLLRLGENPYQSTSFLNWPPLWMQILFALDHLSPLTGVSVEFIIRIFLVVGETLCMMAMLLLLVQSGVKPRKAFLTLFFGVVLNPVAILLTCQHCNFDILVALWVALSILMLLKFIDTTDEVFWLQGCLFLGLGILTKTIPLVLVPLLLVRGRTIAPCTHCLGAFLTIFPVVLGISIIYVLSPDDVWRKVISYSSAPGYFGLSGIITLLLNHSSSVLYKTVFFIFLVGVELFSIKVLLLQQQEPCKRDIILMAALILLVIPTFGPGYGPQYAAWLLPPLVVSYPLSSARWRGALKSLYVVASVTYLVEYALFNSHGSFAVALFDEPELRHLSAVLSSQGGQTLVRLPLFLCLIKVFLATWRELSSPKMSGPVD